MRLFAAVTAEPSFSDLVYVAYMGSTMIKPLYVADGRWGVVGGRWWMVDGGWWMAVPGVLKTKAAPACSIPLSLFIMTSEVVKIE